MTAVLSAGLFTFCSQECAPATTIYNRWHRWSQQGLWQKMFYELSQIVGTHYENSIDSTAIKAHRSARGKKEYHRARNRGAYRARFHMAYDSRARISLAIHLGPRAMRLHPR